MHAGRNGRAKHTNTVTNVKIVVCYETPSIPHLQNVAECIIMGVTSKQMHNFIKLHVMKTHDNKAQFHTVLTLALALRPDRFINRSDSLR
jgi:hypothetical protein